MYLPPLLCEGLFVPAKIILPKSLDANKYIRIFAAFNKYQWRGWKLCHTR